MSDASARTLAGVLARATRLVNDFEARVADVPYEAKGVLPSEMLFLWAAIDDTPPTRIVESGRARAQSTVLLARCFPDTEILSIDRDATSSDARAGRARIRDLPNVTPLDGDARDLLPRVVRPGDVAVIDGPKSFRALLLALGLLVEQRPARVFIHDCCGGWPERELLERLVPATLFSDAPRFVERFAYLDRDAWAALIERELGDWRPYTYVGVPQASYGPTYACLSHDPDTPYATLAQAVLEAGFRARARYLRAARGDSAGTP